MHVEELVGARDVVDEDVEEEHAPAHGEVHRDVVPESWDLKAKLERDNISMQFQRLKAGRLNTGSTRVLRPPPHHDDVLDELATAHL